MKDARLYIHIYYIINLLIINLNQSILLLYQSLNNYYSKYIIINYHFYRGSSVLKKKNLSPRIYSIIICYIYYSIHFKINQYHIFLSKYHISLSLNLYYLIKLNQMLNIQTPTQIWQRHHWTSHVCHLKNLKIYIFK